MFCNSFSIFRVNIAEITPEKFKREYQEFGISVIITGFLNKEEEISKILRMF